MINIRNLFAAILLIAALSLTPAAYGQAALNSTTFSAAVSYSDTLVTVASATNISVGYVLFSEKEAMKVLAKSGSVLTVQRGYDGKVSAHASGATVYGDDQRYFTSTDRFGPCTSTSELVLPVVNITSGEIFNCFGGAWYRHTTLANTYKLSIAPGAQNSAASPTAGETITITGQAGGAQSATTSNGAAGAPIAVTSGAGGVGGTSSGTGGAGGALTLTGGAGAGTITGGAGGAVTVKGGAGANGTSAGGSGGVVALRGGAVGTGGTGTAGYVAVQDTADATKQIKFVASGATAATAITLDANQAADVTVKLPIQTGALTTAYFCGATSGTTPCPNTATGGTARVIGGIATLAANTAVISSISPAFTGTTTFACVANDLTTRANPVQVANTSTSSITITNTTGATDVINWICVGY